MSNMYIKNHYKDWAKMVESAIALLNKHKHTDLVFLVAYPTDTGVACRIQSSRLRGQNGDDVLRLGQNWFDPLGRTVIDDYADYGDLPDADRLVARLAFMLYNLWLRPDWGEMIMYLMAEKKKRKG